MVCRCAHMASSIAPADGDAHVDCFEVCPPNCAWVIPVLMDSHASAAATLAFRLSCRNHHVLSTPQLSSSLRKFSAVKHIVVLAPDSLHPDIAASLKLAVDDYIQRPPLAISQSQLPRWKSDDGSYHRKLMKAHALSLEQFEKVQF
jgi:hypothetical protein